MSSVVATEAECREIRDELADYRRRVREAVLAETSRLTEHREIGDRILRRLGLEPRA